MSGIETERKFLVKKGDAYRRAAFSCRHIRQGYIPADGATVRIRLSSPAPGLLAAGKGEGDAPSAEVGPAVLPDGLPQPAVQEGGTAFLTIKGKSVDGGLSRYEFEKEISFDEAEQLLRLCQGGMIDKHRYLVKSPDGRHTFEVDEFHGQNDGLVMAEVELGSPDEPFGKPDFIGREVTGDRRFYNKHMLRYPFSLWRNDIAEP